VLPPATKDHHVPRFRTNIWDSVARAQEEITAILSSATPQRHCGDAKKPSASLREGEGGGPVVASEDGKSYRDLGKSVSRIRA
jgi:hypothetical protein